jgi:hypothetical protein
MPGHAGSSHKIGRARIASLRDFTFRELLAGPKWYARGRALNYGKIAFPLLFA